ncbi:GGDEF domain-containing protein [Sulfurovum sp. XTW-4]|uniref:diguanylate cyclase n=1 Tax=Sulfurovum xiamenensis TaxID=3019066 RepID=A0ABT7QPX4_9BACT|nr:GGDEF domain-containing protein [Sulfurovum xiamenensis]MDM5263081.1 GGDEF domain-containing protein [Sulfurovum xiamenensis]
MQKEWSSFRITLILYLVILILPFSFYFVYTSFQTMRNDTRIVHQSSWTAGAMVHLALMQNDQETVAHIDKSLQKLSPWVSKNNDSNLYIGSQTLSEDFSQIEACWATYKENYLKHDNTDKTQQSLQCYELTDTFATVIEKMVYLKQNKIINVFYMSLALAMIFALLMIYLVRAYIHQQMKKHAIHDHETKLFNKTYFCAELKTSCARAVRNNAPLSLLSISIDDFGKESKHYSQKMQAYLLKSFGGLITSLIRESDVACRYDDNHFSILLPDTSEENALILEKRVHETLEKHDFGAIPELNFKFATAHLHYKETPEAFMGRIETLLK